MGDAEDVEHPGSERSGRYSRSSRYSRCWGAVAVLVVLIAASRSGAVLARNRPARQLLRPPTPELFLDRTELDFRVWLCKLAGNRRGDLVGPANIADLNTG